MTPLPRVGLPTDHKQIGAHPFLAVGEKYVRAAVDGAGCLPLLVPNMEEVQKYYNAHSQPMREAIRLHQRVAIDYVRADEQQSSRTIEPLGLIFWGKVWTLVAWCNLRDDYRTFRLDRIQSVVITDDKFATGDNKSLKHFLQLMKEKHASETETIHPHECASA